MSEPRTTPGPAPTAPMAAPWPAARVLVVDDTEGNRYTVARMLRGAGYETLEAGTGTEALTHVHSARRPDLVVLDINLPDISGYEVVRRMKGDAATASIPVLHLSASYTESTDQAYGLETGADAYLTHPVEPVVFLATVKALLRAGASDARAHALAAAWQATFDAIAGPIFLLGPGGAIRQANAAGAALLGLADPAGEPDAPGAGNGGDAATLPALLARRFGDEAGAQLRQLAEGARPVRGVDLRLGAQIFLTSVSPVDARTAAGATGSAVCVLTDVTVRRTHERERERLLEAAEDARRDAERANRAKSDFLAVMSHELRTPLNAIGGYVELLTLGIRGPVTEAQREDLERIGRSQRHLLSLINDILNFAKLESGSVHFDLSRFPVDDALRAAADFVEPQLRAKGLRYSCELDGPAPLVHADREKLQQIMLNLLGNAVKFTPEAGAIHVRRSTLAGWVQVTVSDTGRGIPPDKLESIFEPFVQVDRTRSRSQEGVGLGLAISRDLARRMGGDLTAEEPAGGEGACFRLRLPTVSGEPG